VGVGGSSVYTKPPESSAVNSKSVKGSRVRIKYMGVSSVIRRILDVLFGSLMCLTS
jgi:hypothetical protein